MRRLTRRQQISAAALAVLALLFISLDFAGGSLGGARGGATGALGSLYRGTDSILGPVRRFVQGVPDVGGNRREIAQLKQRNAELQRELTGSAVDTATAPGSGFQWTVTVDVGRREHVLVGQTVTDGVGLVGRVVRVYSSTSVVLLVADPASGVGVRDTRSGELLLAAGAGTHGMTASPVDDRSDLRTGDVLVTGPTGKTTFSAGVEVGVITSVHTAAGGVVSAIVLPTATQTGLDLVGIILQTPRNTTRPALTPDSAR